MLSYTSEIIINKPVATCFSTIVNLDSMKHWQDGLISIEHISGTPREIGSIMILNYQFGNRKMKLTESVTHRENNTAIHFNFDTKMMHNVQKNSFEAIDETTTKWTSENEFFPRSFSSRIMLFLIPKAFKKQTQKYLTNFKNYVENGTSIANQK
ncbi:SRPBCC family protein [Mesoflavibacter sp. CH_XMU1404-2]|uniref:SRPBCC family protein n=1 Tax=Mesoflavibacter sp. CH_XMU1404-2 TaxID=3107766 RepID=UPI00300A29F3